MSISKAQALALADNFLDGLGSQEQLKPRQMYSEIILIAGELAEDAQDNLVQDNSIASGRLSESITITEPEVTGAILRTDLLMNFYGKFVNKGVKGTKSGTGLYSFKTEFPSLKMVEALRKSMSSAARKVKTTNVRRTISKNEIKNASISEISRAYGAARNIKRYGIKPTGFLDRAVESAERKFSDRLGAALVIDVLDALR
jgi:hypothetical protein